jgi:hypothetical protein
VHLRNTIGHELDSLIFVISVLFMTELLVKASMASKQATTDIWRHKSTRISLRGGSFLKLTQICLPAFDSLRLSAENSVQLLLKTIDFMLFWRISHEGRERCQFRTKL